MGNMTYKDNDSLQHRYYTMKHRCYSKINPYYKDYGGRGIVMCEEWLKEKNNFINWALENGYKQKLQLDRIDNDGNYEPSNCRWVTAKQNSNNRRQQKGTNLVEYAGQFNSLPKWCDILGMPISTVWWRIKKMGMTIEEALDTPIGRAKSCFKKKKGV